MGFHYNDKTVTWKNPYTSKTATSYLDDTKDICEMQLQYLDKSVIIVLRYWVIH